MLTASAPYQLNTNLSVEPRAPLSAEQRAWLRAFWIERRLFHREVENYATDVGACNEASYDGPFSEADVRRRAYVVKVSRQLDAAHSVLYSMFCVDMRSPLLLESSLLPLLEATADRWTHSHAVLQQMFLSTQLLMDASELRACFPDDQVLQAQREWHEAVHSVYQMLHNLRTTSKL